jgi:hypothetical protein
VHEVIKKLGIFGMIATVCFVAILPFLVKVKVDCKSQYGACPQQIKDKLLSLDGQSLFFARKNINNFLKKEFLVSDYSLQFKIPNILHTELLVKKPVIAFKNVKSDSLSLVDGEGKILFTTASSALPVINITTELPKEGENIGNTNLFALNLAMGVYQMYQVRDFLIQESSLLVELPGQFRVIFPLDGDVRILLGSLSLIYSNIQTEGNPSNFSQVDLRFTNPVLR